jgi:hypothetical protein
MKAADYVMIGMAIAYLQIAVTMWLSDQVIRLTIWWRKRNVSLHK